MCLPLFLEQRPYVSLIKLRVTALLAVELTPAWIKTDGFTANDFYCLAFRNGVF